MRESLALVLHGLPVVPKDIGLQAGRVVAEQMARLKTRYLVYPPGMHLGCGGALFKTSWWQPWQPEVPDPDWALAACAVLPPETPEDLSI